ncbi:hypothetical protein DPMN_051600 [Dreissena polymorpha]|uniref:Uncharacterized protein n=1 Tax=Dreissena polymorpha TaxID=45954 RepID=A0A9D4CK94_DREPO|nr:hypothetical protein DPMN_051600 [Dreissena polymorpha]
MVTVKSPTHHLNFLVAGNHRVLSRCINPGDARCMQNTHCVVYSTANAEQTYFAIRGGKAKRVDAASVVEAASVCGGKSHFAAKLRICPPRHAAISEMMPSLCAS